MAAESSSQRIVLTGASGMLGQAIIRQLASRSDVSVLALYRGNPAEATSANMQSAVADLGSSHEMAALLRKFEPTVFIHAAATGMQIPRPNAAALAEINTLLPVRLAEAVERLGHCSFVQVSSGLAYKDQGRPLREEDPLETRHPYGRSKAEAEKQLRAAAQTWKRQPIIVRPFSFTGEGDAGTRLFPSLLRSACEKRPLEMSAGDQVRDHSSVDDIAAGVTAAALAPTKSQTPQVYNLGVGDTRTLRELLTSVIDQLGLKVNVQFGARPHAVSEPMFMVPDTTRAHTTLGWHARKNVAHAVWRLARRSFPALPVNEPVRFL